MRITELEEKIRRLEEENRSLSRRYTVTRTAIDRNRAYIAIKERMLTALTEEKAKQEKYFNLLLENTQELMLLLDHKLRLVYCSGSFLRQMGIGDFGVINGLSFQDIFSGKVEQGMVEYMQTCLKAVVAERNAIVLLRTLDIGRREMNRHYRIFITPMPDEQGNSKGALIIFNDETEAVEAKEEAERAREQAEAANKAKSSFLAQMSHEIRTPLNAIIGMSELAIRDSIVPASGIPEYLANIRQAGSNLLSIINDILDLSKIESGSFQLVPAPYHFSSLINSVISIIRIRFAEKPIIFIVNIDAEIPNALIGDEARIRQILFNMLGNAIKYTHQGFIKFSVRHKIHNDRELSLYFEVADSGVGIKEEELPGLFGDFIRLDMEHNKGIEGTGLGLAITKRLCQEMGGDITVASEYGKGSVFTAILPQTCSGTAGLVRVEHPERKGVLLYDERPLYAQSVAATLRNLEVNVTIPAKPEDFFTELGKGRHPFAFVSAGLANEAASLIRRVKGRTTLVLLADMGETSSFQDIPVLMMPAYVVPVANMLNGITTSPEVRKTVVRFIAPNAKILIVDDIITNLKVAQGLLVPYRMQVDICDNGNGAIAMAKENRYDLIFMDHMMPGIDGIEATAQIRALGGEYFSRVPIIALTANAIAGVREMFLSKGFNDYLAKPIEISRLNELMEKWIPRHKRCKTESSDFIPADEREEEKVESQNRFDADRMVLNRALLFKLRQALETEHPGAIDLAMDELVMLPFAAEEKNILQNIWDHILASEFKEAV
ncbi:MAG: response regulator, partial [Treponema sp.]|nr:response regulator [Treponema sp.]